MAQTKPNRRELAADESPVEMAIDRIEEYPPAPDGYTPLTLHTTRGPINCRYCPAPL